MPGKAKNFSSQQFITAIQSGDLQAQEALVKSYTKFFYRACLGFGLNDEGAMEVVQETWATFFSRPENFQGRSHIRTYIYGILRIKALEYFRKRNRDETEDLAEEIFHSRFDPEGGWSKPPIDPEKFVLVNEKMDVLESCLEALPENQRAAFVMKEISGSSSEEICNILGVSNTNLGVLLFRARVKLRECIEARIGRDSL